MIISAHTHKTFHHNITAFSRTSHFIHQYVWVQHKVTEEETAGTFSGFETQPADQHFAAPFTYWLLSSAASWRLNSLTDTKHCVQTSKILPWDQTESVCASFPVKPLSLVLWSSHITWKLNVQETEGSLVTENQGRATKWAFFCQREKGNPAEASQRNTADLALW